MTTFRLALLAIALLATTHPAQAGFINSGFESGTFDGWTTTGDALVTGSGIGVTPTGGTYQALLTTASDYGDANEFSHTDLADTTAGDVTPSLVDLDPVFGVSTRETEWPTFTYSFAESGTYTRGTGVVDADDDFIPSGVLIDDDDVNVGPGGPPVAVIPTPSTLVRAGIGIAALGLGRRPRFRLLKLR